MTVEMAWETRAKRDEKLTVLRIEAWGNLRLLLFKR